MQKMKTMLGALMVSGLLLSAPNAFAQNATQSNTVTATTNQSAKVAEKTLNTTAEKEKNGAQTAQPIVLNTVNINTAGVDELQKMLKGIGAKKAQAIVDYRTQHGKFTSVEQLTEIKGIGPATLEKNKAIISL